MNIIKTVKSKNRKKGIKKIEMEWNGKGRQQTSVIVKYYYNTIWILLLEVLFSLSVCMFVYMSVNVNSAIAYLLY